MSSRSSYKPDWRYLAGLFDGEGSVTIADRPRVRVGANIGEYAKYPQYTLWPRITNTSEMLMKSLHKEFGGGLYVHELACPRGKSWKPQWEWSAKNAPDSIVILKGMLPFLRYKKPEVVLALKFLRRVKPNNGGLKLPEREYVIRQKIVDRIKRLKGRKVRVGIMKEGWR